MLPEGWKRVPLGECARFQSGGTPSKERGDYWGGDFPWVTAKDMKTLCLTGSELRLTKSGKEVAAIAPALSVLVLTRGMTLLKDLPVGLVMQEASFNQDVKALIAKDGVDPWYLAYQLVANKSEILDLVDTAGHGTGRLDTELLKGFEVPIAPPEEQRAAAQIIRVWEAAIATAEKLLTNSRSYWLALIAQLLMPVPISTERQAGSFPPSVQPGIPKLPPTPKGWRKVALGAHLHEISRPVSLEPDTEYTLVTVRRSRGGVDKRSVLLGSEIKTPTQFFVAAGDFLISKRQIVHGACGIVPAELDGAVVSNEYAVLGGDGEIDPRFLRFLSETTYFQQTCFHSSIGVHVEKMLFRTEQWLKRPFNIPPLDEQRRIIEILDAARQQIALAEQQLALLKAEKRALMQQLLTGKRRVKMIQAQASV
jgi:type I restriction enzyme, S subunit